MVRGLLGIRVKQLVRKVRGLPALYAVVFFCLLAVLCWLAIVWLKDSHQALAATLFVCGVVVYVHFSRSDKHFIHLIARFPSKVYIGEYVLLTLPFAILLAAVGKWYLVVMLVVSIFLTSLWVIEKKNTTKLIGLSRFAPKHSIEWIAGLRRYGLVLAAIWVGAVGVLLVPYASFIFLLVALFIVSGFYNECESLQLLCVSEQSTLKLLKSKLIVAFTCFFIFCFPVLVVYPLLHWQSAWLAIYFLLISCIGISYAIFVKYALYQPNNKSVTNGMLVVAGFSGLFFPLGLPLTLALMVRFYFKSKHNLDKYLYAYR